jgi:hypothetical protein
MKKIWNAITGLVTSNGRTTAFLIFFTIVGTVLHILHRLDGTYIGFIGTIMGFVLGHSVKEDYFSSSDSTTPSQQ